MTHIGIMQGRLVPPIDNYIQRFPKDCWEKEFELANKAKLECIEWTYDTYGELGNPLFTDEGIEKINALSSKYNVKILSVCGDYFMEKPLIRASQEDVNTSLNTLFRLMKRGKLIRINRVIVPFVDNSRIDSDTELNIVVETLSRCFGWMENLGIEIHLETSLAPKQFTKLLSKLNHPMIKVNYDSGNSSSLGYSPKEEFDAYGEKIGSFHVKDRLLHGSTVPLGTGDTDFQTIKKCLKNINYKEDFILQVARGKRGNEVSWAKQNLEFFLQNISPN